MPSRSHVSTAPSDTAPDTTLDLLTRARAGDDGAMNELFARYLPHLHRWASGRLPRWARDLADTSDVVQETLVHTFKKIAGFEYRGEGALLAYLRQAVMNRIRDELRKSQTRAERTPLDPEMTDPGLSPLACAIGQQAVDRYEAALATLTADERELIVGRVELGLTYTELAAACHRPSSDAARMAVGRALVRLAKEMVREASDPE
jgi:RNA polymerase sigma-70 factor, ECF subfamily